MRWTNWLPLLLGALAAGCGQIDLPTAEALAEELDDRPTQQTSALPPTTRPTEASSAVQLPGPLRLPRASAVANTAAEAEARRLPPPVVETPRAPGEPLDLAFVSSDFVAAVSLRPQALLAAPLVAEFLPAERIAAWAGAFAVDPREVEHALILAGTPHAKTGPAVGMVLRSRRPLDRAKIVATLAPENVEVLHGDKTYLQNQDFRGQSLYFADDRTLVVGQQVQLERMLRAGDDPSPLIDRLRQVDAGAPLVALLAFDPIRELVQEELARSPALPPPFDQFDALAEHLATVKFEANPRGAPLATLSLEGRDAQATAQLATLARTGAAFFRGWLMRSAAQLGAVPEFTRVELADREVQVAIGLDPADSRELVARLMLAFTGRTRLPQAAPLQRRTPTAAR
ncbi:MAG: hypothetical protein U0836_03280 [Pirellulales bacterium]